MLDLTGKIIALLKGGPGSERAVSLKTAESVAEALRSVGAQVAEVDVTGPDFEVPSWKSAASATPALVSKAAASASTRR
jgi:D-alanine-D-alanine ligase